MRSSTLSASNKEVELSSGCRMGLAKSVCFSLSAGDGFTIAPNIEFSAKWVLARSANGPSSVPA